MNKTFAIFKIYLHAIVSLFTNRIYLRNLMNHILRFQYSDNKKQISIVSPDNLFPGIYKNDIILRELDLQFGNMGHNEICILIYLIKYINPKNVFEFGTFNGLTALQIALNTGKDTKIFTLNLPSTDVPTEFAIGNAKEELEFPDVQPGNLFKDNKFDLKIIQLYGDSAGYDYNRYIGKMDFVFVDASHEYEYVKNDTEAAFKMLNKNGVILWHDYPNSSGVKKYLEEQSGKYEIFQIENTHFAIYIKRDPN